jgi:hypothetical protein
MENKMDHRLQDTLSLLARTPATLNTLLRDLPETWTHRNEGENTWSTFDVVGHLVNGERTDWVPRVKMVLEFGDMPKRFKASRWVSYWMNLRGCDQKI